MKKSKIYLKTWPTNTSENGVPENRNAEPDNPQRETLPAKEEPQNVAVPIKDTKDIENNLNARIAAQVKQRQAEVALEKKEPEVVSIG